MSRSTAFLAATLRASLPLWLWAAHFAFSYGGVVVGCHAGWHETSTAGLPPLRWMLLIASALALALCALALRHAWAASRHGCAAGLHARVRLLSAALATIGIAWGSVPALVLPTCPAA